jgi:hypothetical protein
MTAIRLTSAQRRQMRKNAELIDRTSAETDRRFFERFPHRRYRMRLPSQTEVDQGNIVQGKTLAPPPGFRFFVVVCLVAPGIRTKLFAPVRIGCEFDDIDLPESKVIEVWERASTPETKKIAETMRQIGEDRP